MDHLPRPNISVKKYALPNKLVENKSPLQKTSSPLPSPSNNMNGNLQLDTYELQMCTK